MEFSRKDFFAALATVEPALPTTDRIPLLQNIFFTGDIVRASDAIIGIEAPLKTDFVGGVAGKLLHGFVESLDTEKITVSENKGSLIFTSGQARIRLPLEPIENMIWDFPDADDDAAGVISLDEAWRPALEFALTSTTTNSSQDERLGVSFLPGDREVKLASTDGATLTMVTMPRPEEWYDERFAITAEFLEQVLKLSGECFLKVRENMAVAGNAAGIYIHTRYLNVPDATDFEAIVERHRPQHPSIPLPDRIEPALKRTTLIKDREGCRAVMTFYNENGVVRVAAEGNASINMRDDLYYEGDHPDLVVHFNPEYVIRGLKGRETLVASNRCLVLGGPANYC